MAEETRHGLRGVGHGQKIVTATTRPMKAMKTTHAVKMKEESCRTRKRGSQMSYAG